MSRASHHDIARATWELVKETSIVQAREALANYLIEERRTRELTAIMREIERLRYVSDGILEATAVSAHELDEAVQKRIQELLQAKQVNLDFVHDDEVVGGVRVTALDKQLDLSVESKLNQLKHAIAP